ncbi:hypothetical protein D3C86_1342930 [compost metagenome]
MLDIRMPIGWMFVILGGMLAVYGLTSDPSLYRISLGYNLNLLWGGVMTLFGLGMLSWMRLSSPAQQAKPEAPNAEPPAESFAVGH